MPSFSVLLVAPVALLLTAVLAQAQQQQANHSEAKAEAHAEAKGGESRSSTHRVVVENGKTVVDERTDDHQPARGALKPGSPIPIPMPTPGAGSAEDMLRELTERLQREMERLQRGRPFPTPTPAPRPEARPTDQGGAAPAGERSGRLRPRHHG